MITADRFEVRLRTQPVRLLGSNALRDVWADGDQALLRVDAGRDVNGNGEVDFTRPGAPPTASSASVRRAARSSARAASAGPRGDGEFRQVIDCHRSSTRASTS